MYSTVLDHDTSMLVKSNSVACSFSSRSSSWLLGFLLTMDISSTALVALQHRDGKDAMQKTHLELPNMFSIWG